MKIALLQLNYKIGALKSNARKIADAALRAFSAGAELAVTSELALSGYPPRDLLLERAFIEAQRRALDSLAAELASGPALLAGFAERNPDAEGKPLFNCAALIRGGKIERVFRKTLLPTYDVFDEDRYFEPGNGPQVFEMGGRVFGVTICEDVWNSAGAHGRKRYHRDPVENLAAAGAKVVLNLSASPFTIGKQIFREKMLSKIAKRRAVQVLYVNQCGGNDDLVFDGRSSAFDSKGVLFGRAKAFEEDSLIVDLDAAKSAVAKDDFAPESETWRALVTGVRDYSAKCGFKGALIGLSGGVDSAVTAAIAADALGKENVLGVLMPSPYSSKGSVEDALALAKNLGIRTLLIPIKGAMKAFDSALAEPFKGREKDITEENVQARTRAVILMALSNKLGMLVLSTGNKSELAVGYCTIYGDMAGALAVISDVPKTLVYKLAKWRGKSEGREIIPAATLAKPPSAELKPNQTDQDTLPPYETLDGILKMHVEERLSGEEIIARGFDANVVKDVLRMVRCSEFKRRQAAPGIKVTERAFGTGWRLPIARADWWED
jgi:NAD+ synthase/NAD+ synthase (glutamine-hydrolysing)